MTTELEQQFFKVFGIEKNNDNCPMLDKSNCVFVPSECNYYQYPEITDRKLLEMICTLSQSYPLNYEGWSFNTVQDLKETMLEDCIKTAKKLSLSSDFVNKIQQLFKEEE